MNFFEHQDRARGTTRKLVFLFASAVAALIVITSVLVIFAIRIGEQGGEQPVVSQTAFAPDIFLGVSVVVILVVVLGTLYRLAQLRGGGKSVAEGLGGRLLNVQTLGPDERKILNVVEEMAIAAGVPVPQVYLLEDPAINAFAAGYHPQDAVIGVTRGCIEKLNREELQGVIAHEFSHIFNGDMRLNIRLIGWLYGIMVIGTLGYLLMRGSAYGLNRAGRNNKGGMVLLGVGLIVIGYSGTFFGNLIKAAVSRQREFLADASAVQFTRNPGGIGSALKKIGGFSSGSRLTTTDTSEISHMLFAQGLQAGLTGLLATHPPLDVRIRRLEPGWDGHYPSLPAGAAADMAPEMVPTAAAAHDVMGFVATIGEPTAANLGEAQKRLRSIPADLQGEVHNTLGSCLLMHSLIVASADKAAADTQITYLRSQLNEGNFRQFMILYRQVTELDRVLFLPLVDLALPSLRQLSPVQCQVFMEHLDQLIQADAQVSLFEWCLFRILRNSLDKRNGKVSAGLDLSACASECQILLSALAWAGHGSDEATLAAFNAGMDGLQLQAPAQLLPADTDMAALDKVMSRLQSLQPLQKPRLLKALAQCIEKDGAVTNAEGELLRAVGSILDCPIPPLLTTTVETA